MNLSPFSVICIAIIGTGFTIAAYVSFVWKKRRWLYISEMDAVIAKAHRQDSWHARTRQEAERRQLLRAQYSESETE